MLPAPTSPLRRLVRVTVFVSPFALAAWLKIPLCPFALVTHHPCPGCGMTRAAIALAHGDLARAVAMNPIALAIVPIFAAFAVVGVSSYVRDGNNRLNHPFVIGLGLTSVAALYGIWIARWFGAFGGPVPV